MLKTDLNSVVSECCKSLVAATFGLVAGKCATKCGYNKCIRMLKNVTSTLAPKAVRSLLDNKELKWQACCNNNIKERTVSFGVLSMEQTSS
jgi:hypothetical protein